MMHRSHLAPYGYGNVAGKTEVMSQVGQTVITGAAAALMTGIESYRNEETKVGPVPVSLLAAGILHAAAFYGSSEDGELYGMDADYVHSAAAGFAAAWAANRGHEIGKKMREKADAAKTGDANATPATPAAKGLPQGYAGYRPQDVYAAQFR